MNQLIMGHHLMCFLFCHSFQIQGRVCPTQSVRIPNGWQVVNHKASERTVNKDCQAGGGHEEKLQRSCCDY